MMRDKLTLIEAVRTLNDPNSPERDKELARRTLEEKKVSVYTGVRKEQRSRNSIEYR